MEIKKLRAAVSLIRQDIFGDIAMGQFEMFLFIADHEGVTQPELIEVLGMSQGAVSRNCAKLSSKLVRVKSNDSSSGYDEEDRGYDLIEQRQDEIDSRRKALFLTKLGKSVVEKLREI